MALHDDIDQVSRFRLKPEQLGHFVRGEDKQEEEAPLSEWSSDDREDDPNEQPSPFTRALILTWLVAALWAMVILLIQPSSVAPPGQSVGLSLVQAPSPSSGAPPHKPAETYRCSDLDYAHRRC